MMKRVSIFVYVCALSAYLALGGCDNLVGINENFLQPEQQAATPYYANISSAMADGIIHYWRLDETIGAASADETSANNGDNSGTNIVNGKYGKCREFPADAGSSIYIGTIVDTTNVDYTIAFWINLSACSTYNNRYFLYGTEIRIYTTSTGLLYMYDTAAKSLTYDIDTGGFGLNTWVYMVFVIDGDPSVVGTVTLYVNGTVAGTPIVNWVANRNINGANYFGYTGNYNFRGYMDDIAIWNRALSALEVAAVYAKAQSAALVGQ